jgi:hypothetical protein
MTKRQRTTCATLLVVSLGFVGLSLPTSSFAQAPTFGQPTISGIQGVGFEEDIRLDPTNPKRVYMSVPGSLSSDTSWIWHSEDSGKTFKWVTAGTAKLGKPNSCAGGGDTELAVDSAGHLYFNDLTVVNFSTARSGDHGASFLCSNIGVLDTAVDRQWYAVDGDPTTGDGSGTGAGHNIYLVNDEIGPGAPSCPVSGVGNNELVMYRSPTLAGGSSAGLVFGLPNKVSALGGCDEGIMGNDEVSPVATRTGQPLTGGGFFPLPAPVKHVYVIHDDASFSRILIGRCFPVAFGPNVANVSDLSGLNCVDLPVATLGTIPTGKTFPTAKTGGNFPTLAIDKKGNLYAVWEQAPTDPGTGIITGDTVLMYAFSTDEGNHWSTPPITIPTPGLHNNVFAWPAAGDDGRVDIAFYGTSAIADPNDPTCGTNHGGKGGPDSTTNGIWSLYMVQTLNGHAASPTFTVPILAGEHYNHKGTIQTVLGGQCGNRTLGDFLQARVGSHGEAQISYADSNNVDEPFAPHGMYVKQNGGTSLFASSSPVHGDPILLNSASDPAGDAKRETDGSTSANFPNLDILQSSFSRPNPANCHPAGTTCYRVNMTVNNLSLTPLFGANPPFYLGDPVAVWLTQWLEPADPACAPSASCTNGGKNPFVYFESNGTTTSCWSGENAAFTVGGGVALTYPGLKPIMASGACSFVPGAFGTITIDVPIADVSVDGSSVGPNRLYSVTASTMTLNAPAESNPPDVNGNFHAFTGPVGGVLFDLIDVVRAYDVDFTVNGGGGGGGCHEGDGDGHIQGEKSGEASFHVDEDACEDNDAEHVDANDPSGNMDFHSTQITSVAFDDVAHTITVAGLGTDNGLPVAFTIVGVDSSLVPPGLFSISLSDGYTNSGNLLDGSIRLH